MDYALAVLIQLKVGSFSSHLRSLFQIYKFGAIQENDANFHDLKNPLILAGIEPMTEECTLSLHHWGRLSIEIDLNIRII